MGRHFGKVAVVMKNFGFRGFAYFLLIALASNVSHADLVWTQESGWQFEGGVLGGVLGESASAKNALEAMNKAKEAQLDDSLGTALSYYKLVVDEYPDSIFAPEAYFQMGELYLEMNMFTDSFNCYEKILKNYPDYPKFNLVIAQEYKIAQKIQSGATPYLWGWMPWFSDYNEAIKIYESVISNAPFSDYAPMALMNIAIVAQEIDRPELAIDALDRLINSYPQSMFTPDAYLQMAKTYRDMSEGPDYDQASVVKAKDFYQDFMILFPDNPDIATAEAGYEVMLDMHARSRLNMGDFYYYYRDNFKAASIFYNETITLAPKSLAAEEATIGLKRIADGDMPPMTPVDWFFGRFKDDTLSAYQDVTQETKLNAEEFEIKNAEAFITTPGAEVTDTFEQGGNLQEQETFVSPILDPVVDTITNGEGFIDE